MANPVLVNCPADEWTLVAENVKTGFIKKPKNSPVSFLETYRVTVDIDNETVDAPTEINEGVPTFVNSNILEIKSPLAGSNIYLYPIAAAGNVRRDV